MKRVDHAEASSKFIAIPSATADIEGVLVRGAQGIRTLTVVPVDTP